MQKQRSAEDDSEYRENYRAAEYINALYALDNGWNGEGVMVGVLDDGIAPLGELEGQVDRELSRDFGYDVVNGKRHDRANGPNTGDETSTHGTPIAAIIAARNDGQGVQGLAPGATLVSLRVDGMIEGSRTYGLELNKAIMYAADSGIPILNMSLGRENADKPSTFTQSAVQHYHDKVRGLIVNSAGNDAEEGPRNWIDVSDTNIESWLFVVALWPTQTSYELAAYSNTCGAAMARCVASIGSNNTINVNGDPEDFHGTSSAAPQVSAIAAMILSKWPQLSGIDAGNVILSTARDIGDVGVDAVYGHGLIDVQAALSPVNPTFSNGSVISSIGNSVMAIGGAFGYGPTSFEGAYDDITLLDAYGRDFSGDVSGLVVRTASSDGHWLRRQVESQTNAGSTGFITQRMSATMGYTALTTGLRDSKGDEILGNRLTNAKFALKMADGTNVTAGFNSADNVMDDLLGLAPSSDVMFAYSPLAQTSVGVSRPLGAGRIGVNVYSGAKDNTRINGAVVQWATNAASVKLGLVDEMGTVFGTPVGAGAMRFGDGASTVFFEASAGFASGPWSLESYASIGATRLKLAKDMLLTNAEVIASGRFGATASRDLFGGVINFGFAQPLVALSGTATVTTGRGYDFSSQSLIFENRKVDMSGYFSPQLTVGYERTRERSAFRFGASSDSEARDVRAVGTMVVRFN